MKIARLLPALAIGLAACASPAPTAKVTPRPGAAGAGSSSTCTTRGPSALLTVELTIQEVAVLIPLTGLAEVLGVLAYATPPTGTVTSLADLAPPDLKAQLSAGTLGTKFTLDPVARKGTIGAKTGAPQPSWLDFSYDVQRSGTEVTYRLKDLAGSFTGYDMSYPALTLKVQATLPLTTQWHFDQPGTLALAGTTKLRVDDLDLPITIPAPSASPSPGGHTFFGNHHYKVYHPEDCYTIEDDLVTLQNGTTAPLPH